MAVLENLNFFLPNLIKHCQTVDLFCDIDPICKVTEILYG